MIDLEERLQRLADSLELPATTPEDDLARGRARLRHRDLGALGAAAVTAAVIGTSVVLLSGAGVRPGAGPDIAGTSSSPAADAARRAEELQQLAEDARQAAEQVQREQALQQVRQRYEVLEGLGQARSPRIKAALSGYRDILAEDLDPAGTHLQSGPITNVQGGSDSLGTKLTWNGGGMLQVAVGRTLESVQFFCDGVCTRQTLAEARKALVLSSPGRISVAVFQDDGDIVALTADTSFGNNGTTTSSLGLTVDQLLAAAADPRLDLPGPADQLLGAVGTQ